MRVRRLSPAILLLALAAIVLAAGGLLASVRQLAAAYLVAYAATVSVALGVLAMTMIALLTTATWFGAVRRQADLILGALPALAVLGLVLLPALFVLQPLADPGDRPREIYMNPPFVVARTIIYWIAWLAIAESLRSASRMEQRGQNAAAARRYRVIASVGLVVLGVTMTFASFDWMMTLTPHWTSTIYGVYWFGGGMSGALALLTLLSRPDHVAGTNALPALGKLMLTFVLFWVYIGFAQYIVIWSANIPEEVTWHVARTHGAWGGVGLGLLLGAAFVFVILLFRTPKRHHAALAFVGALLLIMHYADTYWMIVPGLVPATAWLLMLSLATLVLVGGATAFVGRVRERHA